MSVNWNLGLPQGNALTGFMQGAEMGRQRQREDELMGLRREQLEQQRFDRKTQLEQQQRERVAAAAQTLRPVYQRLSQMPYAERRAWLQQVAPRLIARGIPREIVEGYDPTDANLQADMELSRRVGEPYTLGEGDVRYDEYNNVVGRGSPRPPNYIPLPPGGRLVLEPGTGGGAVPPVVPPPAPGTVEEGYRFQGGDPADPANWVPVSQGGPTPPASGSFP